MITLVRSELYRMATIRSSWISVVMFASLAAAFGVLEAYWWALFAGVGAFGISVLTVTQHYQHRTLALLYVHRPKRITVLAAQVLTGVLVAWGIAAISGITVLLNGSTQWYQSTMTAYQNTLLVVPIMAVFAAALAVIVRRPTWLFAGFGLWFIVVEGLAGQMKWPLPISAYLDAAKSKPDPFSLEIFLCWTVTAVAIAVVSLGRDLSSD